MYYKLKFCDKCGKIFFVFFYFSIVAYRSGKEDGHMDYCHDCYLDICEVLNAYNFDATKEIENFIDAYNKREK